MLAGGLFLTGYPSGQSVAVLVMVCMYCHRWDRPAGLDLVRTKVAAMLLVLVRDYALDALLRVLSPCIPCRPPYRCASSFRAGTSSTCPGVALRAGLRSMAPAMNFWRPTQPTHPAFGLAVQKRSDETGARLFSLIRKNSSRHCGTYRSSCWPVLLCEIVYVAGR
jgi:hypothetical protein